MEYFLNSTLNKIESRTLLVVRENSSAGCFVTVAEKDIITQVIKVLGTVQVIQEGINATLSNGIEVFVPNVKLNTYKCDKELLERLPEVESMLTSYLAFINNNPYLLEQSISQEINSEHTKTK